VVLGVPITTFIANASSTEMAMAFAALVNALAFLSTLLLVPSMPVQEKLSYGLRKPLTWLSIATIIFLTAAVAYIIWFFTGEFLVPMVSIMVVFGIMFSIQNNINQYWITSAAPEAPDFANGLFVSCSNWGISISTAVGGALLSGIGIRYIVWGGVLFLALSWVSILLRSWQYNPAKQRLM
jgi:predicted MFS family arabinose efflux permease